MENKPTKFEKFLGTILQISIITLIVCLFIHIWIKPDLSLLSRVTLSALSSIGIIVLYAGWLAMKERASKEKLERESFEQKLKDKAKARGIKFD